ncbi:MAG: cofactor-independent phosphoglycerate mutase, partial [Candidatus Desulfofervidaceae bacterium]|nr:cofactor-independent phosphoglycerate mutase [Candidatus Desulfofervidaceae bacterium]
MKACTKFIVLVGDGMGDYPLSELGGKTPLEAAYTPNMDFIASQGILGLVKTVPPGMPPGSDVANMSLMGFDPKTYHTGRGPIEAASLGIETSLEDIIFRCNLVTLIEKDNHFFMEDYSAGHISSEEARILIETLQQKLGSNTFTFYPGVSYRHILIWHKGKEAFSTIPPHDVTGKDMTAYISTLPSEIKLLMQQAREILVTHPINQARINKGQKPANSIWPWGQGKKPKIPSFKEKFGLKGAVISAVDLIKGIGILAGLKVINVPGATGYLDTNYQGKAQYALKALQELDFVYVHVEAPDEAGHEGNLTAKIKAIEAFDAQVVGPVLAAARETDIKVMVTMDHYTPISVRTHVAEPVPFAILGRNLQPQSEKRHFCEQTAQQNGILVEP